MSTSSDRRASVAQAIASVALLRGTFTLRSGRTSSYYLDKYLFSTRPEVLAPLAELFAERIAALRAEGIACDRLAGAELGGIPLVTAASLKTGLPSIFIRNKKKDYGTAKQLEGALLRAAGAKVPVLIATIDRLEGARENVEKAGLRFEALFTKRDLGVNE
jgi:orotate phosphoribosyltransferase